MNMISKILKYLKKHTKLINRIAMIVITLVMVGSITTTWVYASLYSNLINTTREQRQAFDSLELDNESLTIENNNLKQKVQKQEEQLNLNTTTIEEYEDQIKELKSQVKQLTEDLNTATASQFDVGSPTSDPEYKQSTAVWNYLKGLGLNDYVCAGIMGNIMAEVGGHTLDISRYSCVDTGTYYGICQWGWGRKDRLLSEYGTSLDAQLKFLGVELFEVIPADSSFYSMQDEQEAALYFAQYFERCSSSSYEVRQSNASVALDYFT
jgi:uncharacterized protein YoxC